MIKPLVSLVISTKNKDYEEVKKNVKKILENPGNFELILIDQNDDKRFANLVDCFKSEKFFYFSQDKTGLARGRNFGFEKSNGEWIIFFDDDAYFDKVNFALVLDFLSKAKTDSCFYGQVKISATNKDYLTRATHKQKLDFLHFDGVCSIALVFSRKILEKVGLFDENFGVGSIYGAGEEADLILRILKENFEIKYLAELITFHPQDVKNISKMDSYGFGLGAVYRKNLNFKNFIFLVSKFLLEIFGRLFLTTKILLLNDKNNFHWHYLKGFIHGFKKYEKDITSK